MDPLSISASIITLISAASAIEKGLKRLWSLRYAPENLEILINEVTDFRATLKLTNSAVDAIQESDVEVLLTLKSLLIRAQTQLDAIKLFVETHLLKRGEMRDANHLRLSRRAKVREVLGESQRKLDALRKSLANTKTDLIMALTTINMLHMNSLRTTLPLSIQHIGITEPSATSSNVNSRQYTSLREDVLPADIPPDVRTDVISQISSISPQSPRSYLVFRTKLLENTCQNPCACRCHIPFEVRTPHWFRGLIGSIFFQFIGTPVWNYRSCNIRQCGSAHSNPASIYFEYFFPTWLLPWGISITGGWNDLRGVGSTWTLKIPRVLTQGRIQDKMIYTLMYGKVLDARRFMRENGIAAIDVNHCGVSLFECALIHGRDDMCSMLLEGGVDLATQNRFGVTLGQRAWRVLLASIQIFDSYHNVRASLESIYSVEILQLNSLHKIIIGLSDKDLISQIESDPTLVHGRDNERYTPLHWAIKRSDVKAVDVLLRNGADPNAVCIRGISPLGYAAAWSTPKCCKKLLDAGANVRSMDDNGRSPILWALRTHPVNLNLITLLLQYGADPNNMSADSRITCLMESSKYPQIEICEALLDHGANIDAVDQNGWTAIFYAISYNNKAAVETLLDREASLISRDKNNESIIEFAARSGSNSIMRLLGEVRIQGLRMTPKDIDNCWYIFYQQRDEFFSGKREPIESERAALDALIRSINTIGSRETRRGSVLDYASSGQCRDEIAGDGGSWASTSEKDYEDEFHDAVETQEKNEEASRGQPWALSQALPAGPWASIWWAF
ncbi:ankyrin [Zopfia rhizophila CBS 207.26]|uniref:Ankyrin n=1 Tax=Zopfia rhizophila CBS 207.26 TaxID=1314779 RepID=A0A6A6E4C4_9PEZI|nr:ankyrin [Zopfia rhizophila CBS 207.26]